MSHIDDVKAYCEGEMKSLQRDRRLVPYRELPETEDGRLSAFEDVLAYIDENAWRYSEEKTK